MLCDYYVISFHISPIVIDELKQSNAISRNAIKSLMCKIIKKQVSLEMFDVCENYQ